MKVLLFSFIIGLFSAQSYAITTPQVGGKLFNKSKIVSSALELKLDYYEHVAGQVNLSGKLAATVMVKVNADGTFIVPAQTISTDYFELLVRVINKENKNIFGEEYYHSYYQNNYSQFFSNMSLMEFSDAGLTLSSYNGLSFKRYVEEVIRSKSMSPNDYDWDLMFMPKYFVMYPSIKYYKSMSYVSERDPAYVQCFDQIDSRCIASSVDGTDRNSVTLRMSLDYWANDPVYQGTVFLDLNNSKGEMYTSIKVNPSLQLFLYPKKSKNYQKIMLIPEWTPTDTIGSSYMELEGYSSLSQPRALMAPAPSFAKLYGFGQRF